MKSKLCRAQGSASCVMCVVFLDCACLPMHRMCMGKIVHGVFK